jgi:hypothetical protein
MRPYLPTTNGTRTFPSLQYILNNANLPPSTFNCRGAGNPCLVGELLPAISRTMTFQVVARDNHPLSGGIRTASSTVSVDANSGPFVVTSPNTAVTYPGGSTQTVTWNVANTSNAPVSAANVKISLSTDGGTTFSSVLAGSTANDGSQSVTIPNLLTTNGRIKIEAVGNIFFDISDASFTITGWRTHADGDIDTGQHADIDADEHAHEYGYEHADQHADAHADKHTYEHSNGDGHKHAGSYEYADGDGRRVRRRVLLQARRPTRRRGTPTATATATNTPTSTPTGSPGPTPAVRSRADFDGDGKTDVSVYRPSTG